MSSIYALIAARGLGRVDNSSGECLFIKVIIKMAGRVFDVLCRAPHKDLSLASARDIGQEIRDLRPFPAPLYVSLVHPFWSKDNDS